MSTKWRNLVSNVNNSLQCGAIMAAGDVLSQSLMEKRAFRNVDFKRSAKYACIGFIYIGPVLKWWYSFLQKRIPPIKNAMRMAATKVFVDQTIMAPALNLTTMILTASVIHRENQEQIAQRIQHDYLHIMKANYMLWPLVQCVNFSMIPLQYQVIFVQGFALLWYCFLSPILFNQKPNAK